jgi:hypothetical protein
MSILSDIRAKLSTIHVNELAVVENQPALLELWQQMQSLREEMNHAKKLAAVKASEPYLETIGELEGKYSLLLRLSA